LNQFKYIYWIKSLIFNQEGYHQKRKTRVKARRAKVEARREKAESGVAVLEKVRPTFS
jgi:hypothetical protein